MTSTDLHERDTRRCVRHEEHGVERMVVAVEPLDRRPRVVHELRPRDNVERKLQVRRERVRDPHEDAEEEEQEGVVVHVEDAGLVRRCRGPRKLERQRQGSSPGSHVDQQTVELVVRSVLESCRAVHGLGARSS